MALPKKATPTKATPTKATPTKATPMKATPMYFKKNLLEMHDARVERLGKGGKSSDSCALCAKGHKEGELKSSDGDSSQMISFWS